MFQLFWYASEFLLFQVMSVLFRKCLSWNSKKWNWTPVLNIQIWNIEMLLTLAFTFWDEMKSLYNKRMNWCDLFLLPYVCISSFALGTKCTFYLNHILIWTFRSPPAGSSSIIWTVWTVRTTQLIWVYIQYAIKDCNVPVYWKETDSK